MFTIDGTEFIPTTTYWNEDGKTKSCPFSEKRVLDVGKEKNIVCIKLEAEEEIEITAESKVIFQCSFLTLGTVSVESNKPIYSAEISYVPPSEQGIERPENSKRARTYIQQEGNPYVCEITSGSGTGQFHQSDVAKIASTTKTLYLYLYTVLTYDYGDPTILFTPDISRSLAVYPVYIDGGAELEPYVAYIDDGKSLRPYRPFLDTGTEWVSYEQSLGGEQERTMTETVLRGGE